MWWWRILHFVCRDLAAKADGKSDPFATLLFGKEQFNTQVRIVYVLCKSCPSCVWWATSSPIPRRLLHMVGSLGIGMWHYYGHVLSQPLLISFLPVSPSLTHPHSFLLLPSLSLSHLPFGLLPSKIPTGNSKNKISSLEKDIWAEDAAAILWSWSTTTLHQNRHLQLWYLLTEPVHGRGQSIPQHFNRC